MEGLEQSEVNMPGNVQVFPEQDDNFKTKDTDLNERLTLFIRDVDLYTSMLM